MRSWRCSQSSESLFLHAIFLMLRWCRGWEKLQPWSLLLAVSTAMRAPSGLRLPFGWRNLSRSQRPGQHCLHTWSGELPEVRLFLRNFWWTKINLWRYFVCYNGGPVEFDCGETLHWDPINNWCIKEEDSECEPSYPLPDVREVECPDDTAADVNWTFRS